jgi:hypothetical protein
MTYNQKFVVCIKVNGKILREHDDVLTVNFGSEYSILLKNLNSVNAVVRISVDGKDVLNGNTIIVRPNESQEIEGFLQGTKVSNKFKFIQKTKQIQDHLGDKVDDGIIRVEYQFEKVIEKRTVIVEHRYHDYPYIWYNTPVVYGGSIQNNCVSDNSVRGMSIGSSLSNNNNVSYFCSTSNLTPVDNVPLPDEGITVKGSQSDQNFVYGNIGELEETSNVITLKLRGNTSKGTEVKEPIFVNKKIKCETCGIYVESSARFCKNCGTSLI